MDFKKDFYWLAAHAVVRGDATLDQVVDAIMNEFGRDPEEARAKVAKRVEELRANPAAGPSTQELERSLVPVVGVGHAGGELRRPSIDEIEAHIQRHGNDSVRLHADGSAHMRSLPDWPHEPPQVYDPLHGMVTPGQAGQEGQTNRVEPTRGSWVHVCSRALLSGAVTEDSQVEALVARWGGTPDEARADLRKAVEVAKESVARMAACSGSPR